MIHLSTHRTGDINFFAACMSIGIAPALPEPAEVVESDDGRTYLSFRLNDVSECGLYRTQEINRAWSKKEAFRRECQGHPFLVIMDFIDHSRGAKTKDDWIEKAASFLGVYKDSIRKDLNRVSALENELPDSPLTYVLCYILNRFAAIHWAKTAMPKTVINAGASVLMLDGKLPSNKRMKLLSYI